MKVEKTQKDDVWRARIGEWRNSGQTQAGYCREKRIALSTFGYWRRRLTEPVLPQRFVRMAAVDTRPATRKRLTLILPDGLKVVFSERTPMSSVVEILEKLCGSTGVR